jgi:hypothetical protein
MELVGKVLALRGYDLGRSAVRLMVASLRAARFLLAGFINRGDAMHLAVIV